MTSIICDNLYKKYKGKQVLNGFSFECNNEILFLAGKNGAGKTTFIRIALGMEKPDKGTVTLEGNSSKKGNVGVVFDTPCLYPHMTCKENIDIFCTGFLHDKNHVNKILQNLQISNDLLHKHVGKCSFGQQHRICVAIALIRKPTFLFLDEPTIGLDPISWSLVRKSIIKNRDEQNGSVIITGQDYFEMASFSNKIVILDEGICKFAGPTKKLLDSFPSTIALTTADILPENVLNKCENIISNNDGTKTYCFSQTVDQDYLLKTINEYSIVVKDLKTYQLSLKEAVYKTIGNKEVII